MKQIWIGLVLLFLLALNLYASVLVVRDDCSARGQKIAQLVLVWLLPGIGALLVLVVHREVEKPSGRYRDAPEVGDDFAASGRGVRQLKDVLDDD
jgi:orotidine-5'-phosphate decarboxylase